MLQRPGPSQRWRCTACGNLTRFDVERRPHLREFVHLDLAGEPTVESTEVVADGIVSVTCRWCRSDRVAVVDRPSTTTTSPRGAAAGGVGPPP